jgi:hypothetical protein
MAVLVNTVGGIITALDLDLSSHIVAGDISADSFGHPPGLLVSETKLSVNVEAPCVKVT